MLRHVVLFRWASGTTPDQVEAITTALRALPRAIPEIAAYVTGPDLGLEGRNHDYAVVADFADESAYLTYRDHPRHVAVITEHIRPVLADRVAVQYEVA
jgi:hypothetical protein